ncbi:MAG: hypothetical protein GWP05_10350 [Anaerolineaceae bacterium]|nr:hypothetical protein [Anaerolineaceae bacterium]
MLYDIWTALVFVAIIAAAVCAVVISRRFDHQHDRSGDSLWDELGEAHGLTRRQLRRLREAAEKASLDPAALIFVEPHILKQAVRESAERSARRGELEELTSRLHG